MRLRNCCEDMIRDLYERSLEPNRRILAVFSKYETGRRILHEILRRYYRKGSRPVLSANGLCLAFPGGSSIEIVAREDQERLRGTRGMDVVPGRC